MEFRIKRKIFGAAIMLTAALLASTAVAKEAVTVKDVNLDSIPDVVVLEDGQITTFLGKGDGTFEEAQKSGEKRTKTPHDHTADIMKENDAQVAVTLNKNLSFDVLGVRAGKRIEPCKKGKGNDCHFDRDKIFAQKTFTITIVKGSCCAYISGSDSTYEYCSPPFPIEFIRDDLGGRC